MIKVTMIAMMALTTLGWSQDSGLMDAEKPLRLEIVEGQIEVEGRSAPTYEIRVSDGQDMITRKSGECFNVVVDNKLSVPSSLHWHGLIVPWQQDGTSYVSQMPIPLALPSFTTSK
jgi:FtsP/CotA-like multicopper oxidase with cupredoxin domain